MSNVPTTTICGYYNGNKWPIQLVISRYNITLHLAPGQFILDKRGQLERPADTTAWQFVDGAWHRKINDPFFESYASTKQLKREIVEKPVSVITVPLPAHVPATVPASQCDGQAVRSVTEWRKDTKGQLQPVIPAPQAVAPQATNKHSVIPLTMEEAKKRGLIGKSRIVPEDFGVTDTDGAPILAAPQIKYSIDSTMNKGVAPLPEELTQVETKDVAPQQVALKQQLQAQLGAATKSVPTGESETGFLNAVTQNAPAGAGILAGKTTPAPAAAPNPQTAESASFQDSNTELPSPVLEEAVAPQTKDTDSADLAHIQSLPPTPAHEKQAALMQEQQVAKRAAVKQPSAREKYRCLVCQQGFPFRSQLKRHAEQQHPTMVDTVLATYPE